MLALPFEAIIEHSNLYPSKWPSLQDLKNGDVYVPPQIFDEIIANVRTNQDVVVIGGQGRGKSTLVKVIGYSLLNSDEEVWLVDCTPSGKQTAEQVGHLLEQRDKGKKSPIWILDDIQNDRDQLLSLYQYIRKCKQSRFVYVWRTPLEDASSATATDLWLIDILRGSAVVPLKPQASFVLRLVNKYIRYHGGQSRFQPAPVVTPADSDHLLALTGGDLRKLVRYLDIWDPTSGGLSALKPQMIMDHIWQHTFRPLSDYDYEALKTYVELAAVAQLDVRPRATGFSIGILQYLTEQGLVTQYSPGHYAFGHASDARDVVEAFARAQTQTTESISRQMLIKYLDQLKEEAVAGTKLGSEFSGHLAPLMRGLSTNGEIQPAALSDRFLFLVLNSDGFVAKTTYVSTFCKTPALLQDFITELHRIDFIGSLVQTKPFKVQDFLLAVQQIDPITAEQFEHDLVPRYSGVGIERLQRALRYFMEYGNQEPLAQAILKSLLKVRMDESIRSASIESCGKLMDTARKIDEEAAAGMAKEVARHIRLSDADSAQKLSLLLNNLRFDETSHLQLINRVISECKPNQLVNSGLVDGCSYLARSLISGSRGTGQSPALRKFVIEMMGAIGDSHLKELRNKSLASLTWSALLIEARAEDWIKRIHPDLIRRFADSDTLQAADRFVILWDVLQVNEEICRRLIRDTAKSHQEWLGNLSNVGAVDLPLIGLLSYSDAVFPVKFVPNIQHTTAADLLLDPRAPQILFALLGAKKIDSLEARNLVSQLTGITPRFEGLVYELIDENPLQPSRDRLRDIADTLSLTIPEIDTDTES